jgi:flagellar basal body-associated protein FliL
MDKANGNKNRRRHSSVMIILMLPMYMATAASIHALIPIETPSIFQ